MMTVSLRPLFQPPMVMIGGICFESDDLDAQRQARINHGGQAREPRPLERERHC
jgi:hypothetical protein